MPKEQRVNVRVADDLAADVSDYADQHNLSDAEALRRFADRGRIEYGYAGGDSPTTLEEVAGMLYQIGFILGLAFLLLSFLSPSPLLFFIAAGSFSVAAVTHIVVWTEPALTENLSRGREEPAEPSADPE